MFLAMFSVRFWLESGKMCKNNSTFFIFTIILQIFPAYFNSWGGRDRKISALVSAPVSALYMSFGSQGWTALLELVDTAGLKV